MTITTLSGEACHRDDTVDVSLSKVVRRDDVFIIIILIVVAATVTVVPDRGQDQRRIGFIDSFNGGSVPMGMVVDSDVVDGDSSRSNEFVIL